MPREYLPVEVVHRIRKAAKHRCGYCHSPQHLVFAPLQLEHIIPLAAGGTNDESNIWLACSLCNGHKADRVVGIDPETAAEAPLFNPRQQRWSEHFQWSVDSLRVIGLTPIGRATVAVLHLDDDPIALLVRSYWIQAGWHPPRDE